MPIDSASESLTEEIEKSVEEDVKSVEVDTETSDTTVKNADENDAVAVESKEKNQE